MIIFGLILVLANFEVLAHLNQLDVLYDYCSHYQYMDDFTWYYNSRNVGNVERSIHISDNNTTLYYYFFDYAPNDSTTWSTGTSYQTGQDIKEAFAESMEYWNDVYYYTYDNNGNRTTNQIVNIIEGTINNYDIAIYPVSEVPYVQDYIAGTIPIIDNDTTIVEQTSDYEHLHCNKWKINVNVRRFHTGTNGVTEQEMVANRLRTGAHEVGHILGLCDIDEQCNYGVGSHQLMLMGYINYTNLSSNYTYEPVVHNRYVARPTYYDISGVAINRGFHDDSDHIWIFDDSHSKDRVFCALCNGFIDDVTINNGMYNGQNTNYYLNCIHGFGTEHEYRLVATNGETDYYKCMYCHRIVNLNIKEIYNINNSFTSVSDNEIVSTRYFSNFLYPDGFNYCYKLYVSDPDYYIYVNNNGIEDVSLRFDILDEDLNPVSLQQITYNSMSAYKFYLSNGVYYIKLFANSTLPCIQYFYFAREPHTHQYNHHYIWRNYTNHESYCSCGSYVLQPHAIDLSTYHGNGLYTCIICGGDASSGFIPYKNGNIPISENGSFILPNGVIVLDKRDYYLIDLINDSLDMLDDKYSILYLKDKLYIKRKESIYD